MKALLRKAKGLLIRFPEGSQSLASWRLGGKADLAPCNGLQPNSCEREAVAQLPRMFCQAPSLSPGSAHLGLPGVPARVWGLVLGPGGGCPGDGEQPPSLRLLDGGDWPAGRWPPRGWALSSQGLEGPAWQCQPRGTPPACPALHLEAPACQSLTTSLLPVPLPPQDLKAPYGR